MLDWHTCQICYHREIIIILLLVILSEAVNNNLNINKPYNQNPRADKA